MLAVANTPEINDREEHGASNKLWETSRLVYLLEDTRFSPNNNLLPDGPKELCCRFRDMLENTRIALFPYEPANHETEGVESSPVAPPKRVSGCNPPVCKLCIFLLRQREGRPYPSPEHAPDSIG